MSDNALPALCQFTTLCVSKQKAILLCQNEARSDCIHPNLRAIFPRHVNRQPLSEVCHCCLNCFNNLCRRRSMQAKNGHAHSRLRQGKSHYTAKYATSTRNNGSQASYIKERLKVCHVGFSPEILCILLSCYILPSEYVFQPFKGMFATGDTM